MDKKRWVMLGRKALATELRILNSTLREWEPWRIFRLGDNEAQWTEHGLLSSPDPGLSPSSATGQLGPRQSHFFSPSLSSLLLLRTLPVSQHEMLESDGRL